MHDLQPRDAKATLSAVIDQARAGDGAIITRHGKPAAVILGFEVAGLGVAAHDPFAGLPRDAA